MRKLFSLFVALLATTALWAYDFQSGDLYYNITSDTIPYTAEVTYQYKSYINYSGLTEITIPLSVTYNNITYNVTSIGNYAFYLCNKLTSIIIPKSVTKIGTEAFCYSSITSITIPNSVTNIGTGAFYCCSSITSITIPESVTSIGANAFAETGFYNDESNWEDGVLYIDNCLIEADNRSISGEYTIKDSTRLLANNAFYDCSKLTSITIPNTVTNIGYGVFYRCNVLTSVTIPNGVTNIGSEAFYSCSSITSITIPESVTSIGQDAFEYCSSLTSIVWNARYCNDFSTNDILSPANGPFDGCPIRSFTIGEDVEILPAALCHGMKDIQSITIPKNVRKIGDYTFQGCSSLTSITIPNSVTNIGQSAFKGCSSLASIVMSNRLKSIEHSAFMGCSSLTSISIPDSVTSIGYGAFYGCSSLTSITIPKNITSIGDPDADPNAEPKAFYNCSSLATVIWNATNYEDITRDSNRPFYGCKHISSVTFGDGVKYIPAYLCNRMENLKTVIIPNSVTDIKKEAFYYCPSLTSITIPNSVTNIESKAFYDCVSLRSLTIGSKISSIRYDAFDRCSSISNITITADSMEEYLNGCTNAKLQGLFSGLKSAKRHLLINHEIITDVVIPESIDTIQSSAFYNCSDIRSLTLHDDITDIFGNPFLGCDSIQSITIITSSIEKYCQNALNYKLYNGGLPHSKRKIIINGQEVTSLVIPESVNVIDRHSFYNCTALTSLALPKSIEWIKGSAFYGCENLEAIYQTSSTPPSVSSDAFSSLPVCYVPYGSLTAYEKSNWAAQVRKFVEEPINGYKIFYTSSNGKIVSPSITNAFNTTIFSNVYENGQGIITFDGPVHTIKTGAFLNCSTLTSITIPFSIEHIEDRAFANCSALGVVDVKCTTPPALGEDVFTSAPTCYIPCGTNYLYETSAWNKQVGEFVVEDCEGKQIFYTTANGNIITPPTADLGANLIGNVYENGQGIMTFDGPVTKMAGFSDCATLTSITIPESVTSVGGACFKNCPKLTSIIWNAKRVVQIKWGGGTWLGASLPAYDMFEGVRSQITSFVFGESVEYIPDYLCYCMEKLTSVVVPNNVTAIGGGVFKGCTSLTYAKLSDQITDMPCLQTGDPFGGGYAYHGTFTNCSALTEVILPQNLLSVGAYAFKGCSSLPTVVLPESVLAIGTGAFHICTSLSSITIPKNVTSIGSDAFRECSSLTAITIPNSVTNIGQNAFYNCTSLSSVVWNARYCNDFLTTSGSYTQPSGPFYGCPITSFTIGEDVDILPAALCHGMSDIQSITIPNSLRKIGDYTFSKCSSLNSITIPNSVTNIGQAAFDECSSLTTITIPEKVSKIGWGAFSNCASLKSVIWNAINTGDILTSSSYATTPFSSSPIETLVIGDKVTYVPQKLCYDCSTLTSVTIGKSVKEIGTDAFLNCTSLAQTNFEGSISNWCKMTFGNMHSNPNYYSKSLHINGKEVKDIVIPNTVSSISNYAFYNCENISSVKIPESVKSIGSDAFGGCKKLFDIYSYPTTPPKAEESSFANYNVNLYVPCDNLRDYQMDMVFGSFKYIQCLEDTTPSEPTDSTIYHPTEYVTICEGEVYIWRSNTCYQSGIYTHTETIEDGEYIYHHVYTLELTILPLETIEYAIEAEGEYVWHDIVYTESGLYTYEYECTTEKLHLVIIPSKENQSAVVIEPSTNSATITWQKEDDAVNYIIVIQQDNEMVCTLIFDAHGNLLLEQHATSTEGSKNEIQYAEKRGDSFQYTIMGLTPTTNYSYTLTTTNAAYQTLNTYSGEFITESLTGIEDIYSPSDRTDTQKFLQSGQLLILRDGKIYNVMGQEM